MSLIVTPGASNADSYGTLVEAAAFHDLFRRGAQAATWTAFDDDDKEAFMRLAALLMDAAPWAWAGAATYEVQALGFPRTGLYKRNGAALDPDEVPREIKYAQAEFARQLGEADRLSDNDVVNQNLSRLKAGPVELEFRQTNTAGAIVPAANTASLAGNLYVPDVVKVMLVPGWMLPTAEQVSAVRSGFLFRALE